MDRDPVRWRAGFDVLDPEPDPAELLAVDTEHRADAVVIHVQGEVDMFTSSILATPLLKACATAPSVVVDLSRATFLASAGLALLVSAHERCTSRGVALRLTATGPAIQRSLHATGLHRVLDYEPSGDRWPRAGT